MIKVLSTQAFQKACRRCGSHLEYTSQDIQEYKTTQDYLGDYDIVLGIECPVCETVLTHEQRTF